MAVINHDKREVTFKLVYCGTPMGGKTANLSYIHRSMGAERRGELVSLATAQDRTLFFDFLPVHTTSIHGYRTKFMIYTVPGQVGYSATRQMVLRGGDGVVFVADSQLDRMEENLVAWQGMQRNLADNGMAFAELPAVLQCNKRDLPDAAPLPYLEYLLNAGPRRLAVFPACALSGVNVFATLNALAQEVLHRFHYGSASPGPRSA